jgi:hypothetical protein
MNKVEVGSIVRCACTADFENDSVYTFIGVVTFINNDDQYVVHAVHIPEYADTDNWLSPAYQWGEENHFLFNQDYVRFVA